MDNNLYLSIEKKKAKPNNGSFKYVQIFKNIVEAWEKGGIPFKKENKSYIRRIKQLELDGYTEKEILIAVNNYAKSEWHRENRRWKSLFCFLDKLMIYKWQVPALSFPKNERYNNIPKADGFSSFFSRSSSNNK